ncbi:helix-turn-helix domain-containing protein [Aureimonas sp. AU40]|uniref:helix-turn-helix domain-containing protein n=1 Tax=Aureimonas sp. AU40 TaxID=1637747 RepID=UPI000AEDF088|nr:helix-turn-helix domain-containing protein [Aureimonas sp. AU40]
MTDHQARTPGRVRGPILACLSGASDGTRTLAPEPAETAGPHPDFLARAAIWRDQAAGLLSLAEARLRSAAIGREPVGEAASAPRSRAPRQAPVPRPRHSRPAPQESRQYAQPMATTAARDDRLTPHAKAFLQVLRARCGKTRETTITKGTAGNIMSRSPRTIRRYLVDLVRFGYIELKTRCNARGLHLGLTVTLTERVLPFFEEARGLARWLAETPKALFQPFSGMIDPSRMASRDSGVTVLSSRNQSQINSSIVLSEITEGQRLSGTIGLWKKRESAITGKM